MAEQQILVRTPEGVGILRTPDQLTDEGAPSIPGKTVLPAPYGARLAVVTDTEVKIFDTKRMEEVCSLPVVPLYQDWSPQGGYLVTIKRPCKSEDGNWEKNLQVWDVSSGNLVLALPQRTFSKDTWPLIFWAPDEATLYHSVTNTIHVYTKEDGFSTYKKVPVKGLGSFSPSPTLKPTLAVFIPEVKGQPAAAMVLDPSGKDPTTVTRRSFYRATGARFYWNKQGTVVLVMAYSETDVTNQSYYGEQKLHFLPSNGDDACAVPIPKEGPVHDVQWSPLGDVFCVVSGFMPANVTIFNQKCKAVVDLGNGPYNTIKWNPFGRFLCVAGFGNLPGDIVIYDRPVNGSCVPIGRTRCEAVVCSWSPAGRHLMCATTSPRLRVDNGIKMFTYFGEKVSSKPFEVLLDAQWLPVPEETFQDRPPSPGRQAIATTSATASEAPKASPYRPPQARDSPANSDPKDRLVKMLADRKKAAPPGAEFAEHVILSKSAKKRASKKKGGGDDGPEVGGEGGAVNGMGRLDHGEVTAEHLEANVAEKLTLSNETGVGDASAEATLKKVRAIQKKLRQIQQLKEKRDQQGEGALEPEQKQKVLTEDALLQELKTLQGTV